MCVSELVYIFSCFLVFVCSLNRMGELRFDIMLKGGGESENMSSVIIYYGRMEQCAFDL